MERESLAILIVRTLFWTHVPGNLPDIVPDIVPDAVSDLVPDIVPDIVPHIVLDIFFRTEPRNNRLDLVKDFYFSDFRQHRRTN